MGLSLLESADDARRVAGDDETRWHVTGDDAAGPNDAAPVDGDAFQDDAVHVVLSSLIP